MEDMRDAIGLCANGLNGSYLVTRNPQAVNVGGRTVVARVPTKGAWAQKTYYAPGDTASNGGQCYQAVQQLGAWSSANGGGPSGQGSGIQDGQVVWNWVAPAATQFTIINASMQPVPGNVMSRLPELYRTAEVRWLFGYSPTPLQTQSPSDVAPAYEADVVTAYGSQWKVIEAHDWVDLGTYRKVLVARISR